MTPGRTLVMVTALLAACRPVAGAEMDKLIARIKAVGKEGAGNQDAAVAWKELVEAGVDALIPTIRSLGDAPPTAANWLRPAVDAIAEREARAKRPLPADQLEGFVKDAANAPASRRVAYELLVRADPKAPERLLPGMLNDPNVDIRRDAIAAEIDKASPLLKGDRKKAAERLRTLFAASRDKDQAEQIAKTLRSLGEDVDLTSHFGFITKWMVVGPFDGTKGSGFLKPFEPEKKVDLNASYTGKGGKPLKWASYWTFDTYGSVDLNEALGKHKDAVGYAFAAVESPEARAVELRVGCIAAVEVFLNGERLFSREEYHHGQRVDQYTAAGTLKKGRNEILVKVQQNNQTESWAQEWTFLLRVCDAAGTPVPLKLLTAN